MANNNSAHVIAVSLPGGGYPVHIGAGLLDRLGGLLAGLLTPYRALLVTDMQVDALYGERCLKSLSEAGWRVYKETVAPGETSKTLEQAARLYDTAAAAGLDRRSPVIALGGGVVGDLAGFVAATYLRGVPLVQVPTTLLAMADSSVGGKTAVNHPRGKNLIGAFYQPILVAVDTGTLRTLPPRQLRAGAAEVIKYGLIIDAGFFNWLKLHLDSLLSADPGATAYAVERSVRAKAAVVEKDEREADYRRVLNFGHTVGHALEAATGYAHYLHGEAVLAGMIAAVRLSREAGLLEESRAAEALELLNRVGCPPPAAGLSAAAVMDALQYDKKRRGSRLPLILLRAIGETVITEEVEPEHLKKAIESVLTQGI